MGVKPAFFMQVVSPKNDRYVNPSKKGVGASQ